VANTLEKAVATPDCGNLRATSSFSEVSAKPAGRLRDPTEWFALAVKPRCSKAVARILEMKGYETLLPLYRKQHDYPTRSRSADLPLFPGYLFCRFDVRNRLPILITPGVTQILGIGNAPAPLCESEIFSLQTAMNAHLSIQPFPFFQTGQKVRISKGVLAGVEGIIMTSKQCLRLVISITLLQRSVLLEIDRDQVCVERTLQLAA
jgi:transcription antitermination factor NusG